MKICFISNPDSSYTRRWINWFTRRGYEVLLLADTPNNLPWPEVKIVPLVGGGLPAPLKYLVWGLAVRRVLRDFQPQILHAHRVSPAGWIAALSGFHPMVVTPWGSDLYQQPQNARLAAWLARQVLERADLVTADSQDLCNTAIHYGASPPKTHLVMWGIDTSLFYPGEGAKEIVPDVMPGTGPIILSPRAMKPIYNIDVIIETIPAVRATLPAAIYLLRDYNRDPVYKTALERKIQETGAQDAVRWIGRVEPWERIAEIYRLADLVISIASSDGTPGSVLEAMACGVPVIASDLPSLREWILPGENGLLVPPRDPDSLTRAILDLWGDNQMRSRFIQHNRVMVKRRADHDQEMQKMEKLYKELV